MELHLLYLSASILISHCKNFCQQGSWTLSLGILSDHADTGSTHRGVASSRHKLKEMVIPNFVSLFCLVMVLGEPRCGLDLRRINENRMKCKWCLVSSGSRGLGQVFFPSSAGRQQCRAHTFLHPSAQKAVSWYSDFRGYFSHTINSSFQGHLHLFSASALQCH